MATETVELKVAMSCQGCVGAVKRVLTKLEGVDSYDIDLKQQKVTVIGKLPPPVVFEAVSKTGKATSFWPAEEKASEEVKEESKVETPVEETVKG